MRNSRLALLPFLTGAHVEGTAQGWNSLLRVDLAMFRRRPSLSVAILTKFLQQITHCNQLSVLIGQHDFNNFCNLSRLISKKGGFTPVLANHKKGTFSLKRAFLGESQRPVRQLSDQISSFRLEAHKTFFTYVQLRARLHETRSELKPV